MFYVACLSGRKLLKKYKKRDIKPFGKPDDRTDQMTGPGHRTGCCPQIRYCTTRDGERWNSPGRSGLCPNNNTFPPLLIPATTSVIWATGIGCRANATVGSSGVAGLTASHRSSITVCEALRAMSVVNSATTCICSKYHSGRTSLWASSITLPSRECSRACSHANPSGSST